MGGRASQTIKRTTTITRVRTPRANSSNSRGAGSGQKRCSSCGRYM